MKQLHWLELQGTLYPDERSLSGFGVPNRLLECAYSWHDATESSEILSSIYPYRNIGLDNAEHSECAYTAYYGGFVVGEREYSVIDGLELLRDEIKALNYVNNQLFAISETVTDDNERLFRAPEPPVKRSINYLWAYFMLGLYDGNTKAYGVADDVFLRSIILNMKAHLPPRQLMEALLVFFFKLKPEVRIDFYQDDDIRQLLLDIDFASLLAPDDVAYLQKNLPAEHVWPIKNAAL